MEQVEAAPPERSTVLPGAITMVQFKTRALEDFPSPRGVDDFPGTPGSPSSSGTTEREDDHLGTMTKFQQRQAVAAVELAQELEYVQLTNRLKPPVYLSGRDLILGEEAVGCSTSNSASSQQRQQGQRLAWSPGSTVTMRELRHFEQELRREMSEMIAAFKEVVLSSLLEASITQGEESSTSSPVAPASTSTASSSACNALTSSVGSITSSSITAADEQASARVLCISDREMQRLMLLKQRLENPGTKSHAPRWSRVDELRAEEGSSCWSSTTASSPASSSPWSSGASTPRHSWSH